MNKKDKNPSDSVKNKLDPNGFFDLSNDALSKGNTQYLNNRSSGADGLIESPFESDFFNSKLLGFDLGEVDQSAFNSKDFKNPLNPNIDFGAIRAAKQSTFTKIGALSTQFLGKTTIGIVGNVVGGFVGLTQAITQGDTSKLWDNDTYNAVDDINEMIEAKNTAFVNNNDGIGFNAKTAKELSDAFSFIASAIASEAIMQTTGNALGGFGIASLPGRAGKYLSKIGKIMSAADKVEDIEKLALNLGKSVEEMAKIKRRVDLFTKGPLSTARKILTTTGYEAGIEARGARDEFISKMSEELDYELNKNTELSDEEKEAYKKEKLKEIELDSEKVAMATFLTNTALLGVSNAIQFPTIFGSSLNKSKNFHRIERAGIDNAVKASSKSAKILNTASTLGRILKSPVTEFFEETTQGLASNVSQNYFETMLGDQTNVGVLSPTANNLANSLWKGLEDTYGTSEGRHEGIIGAIVGAVGLPGFKNRKLSWNGGLPEAIRQEREKRKYTENALLTLNSAPLSDVVKYNRDNAIRASVDTQAEDLAIRTGNQNELDSVNDNKVFRYTMERMSKGLNNFITEDISELRELSKDLDKYKETFGKDDSFTKEDAEEEINAFEEKTKIYSDAYKAVHKVYNSTILRDDPVTNKLTDVLTYAVASEKLYGDKLEKAKQKLFDITNSEFTKQEIDEFVNTSAKVSNFEKELDKYIIRKELELEKNKNLALKSKLKEGNQYLLDISKEGLELRKKDLESKEEIDKEELEQINIALKNKDAYDAQETFYAKKSSKARNLKKSLDEIVDEVNKEITEKTSRAIAQISRPKEKLTKKELSTYLEQKNKIKAALNKEYKSKSTLDLMKSNDSQDLIKEINHLTDKFTSALNIASYLYGFNDNPAGAYNKIAVSELEADLSNTLNQAHIMRFTFLNDMKSSEELEKMLEEVENSLDILKTNYSKHKELLNKEGASYVDSQIKNIEKIIKDIQETIEVKEKKEAQTEEAKEVVTKETVLDEQEQAFDFGDVKIKEPEISTVKSDLPQEKARRTNSTYNRLSISEEFTVRDKGFKSIQELIVSGELQVDAPIKLTLLNKDLNPNKNKGLKAFLEKVNKLEEYTNELEEFEKSNKLGDNLIKYAPINMKIYDKKDNSNAIYSQFLFGVLEDSPVDTEAYNTELKVLEEKERIELKNNVSNKKLPEGKILNKYKELKQNLYNKHHLEYSNNKTNLRFRTELLNNYIQGINNLDLKVKDIKLGSFQDFKINGDLILENSITELGFDENTKLDDIFYTNQEGKYVRIDGEKSGHIFSEEVSNNTGKLYFTFTNKNGKKIPLKMNTKKLGLLEDTEIDYASLIYNKLEEYFEEGIDKQEYKVSKTGISFLDNSSMKDFLGFFLKNRQNKTIAPIFLKNAYSLYYDKKGKAKFTLHSGGVDMISIDGLKELKAKKQEIITELKNSRFFVNSDWLVKDNKINKEVLKYLIDNKIINHSFDVNKNYDKIYEPGQTKEIIISDNTTISSYSKEVKESFDSKFKALRNKLGDPNSLKEGYEPNVNSVLIAMVNKIQSIIESQPSIDVQKINKIINQEVNSRINSIEKLGKEFPQYMEKGKVLDLFKTFIEEKRQILLNDPDLVVNVTPKQLNSKNKLDISPTSSDTLKAAFGDKEDLAQLESFANQLSPEELLNRFNFDNEPVVTKSAPKPNISVTKYLKSPQMRSVLKRTFTSENNVFLTKGFPKDIVDNKKKFLKENNINNITIFVQIFEAFKSNNIIPNDTDITKMAEFLFKESYPKKC